VIDPDVRRASGHDAVVLAVLEREARATIADRRGGRRWLEEHPARSDSWGTTIATDIVLVAHIDEVVVGYLVLCRDGDVAMVDDVYVDPGAREVGFGDALLAEAVAEARRAGATVFEAEALPGDRETKNLYERAGITARLIVVSTRLDD
jgi:GNAT superfamily N-acetyltransferase